MIASCPQCGQIHDLSPDANPCGTSEPASNSPNDRPYKVDCRQLGNDYTIAVRCQKPELAGSYAAAKLKRRTGSDAEVTIVEVRHAENIVSARPITGKGSA